MGRWRTVRIQGRAFSVRRRPASGRWSHWGGEGPPILAESAPADDDGVPERPTVNGQPWAPDGSLEIRHDDPDWYGTVAPQLQELDSRLRGKKLLYLVEGSTSWRHWTMLYFGAQWGRTAFRFGDYLGPSQLRSMAPPRSAMRDQPGPSGEPIKWAAWAHWRKQGGNLRISWMLLPDGWTTQQVQREERSVLRTFNFAFNCTDNGFYRLNWAFWSSMGMEAPSLDTVASVYSLAAGDMDRIISYAYGAWSPELLQLRDLFQEWTLHKRIEVDMSNLLPHMYQPLEENVEERYAWKWPESWNTSFVEGRINTSKAALGRIEADIVGAVKSLRERGLLKPNTTVQNLVHCTSGHLSPKLFPDQPVVSFMLQYFKRPQSVMRFVSMLQICQALVPSEFLVNVDSPGEGELWANLSYATQGFVVPVFSYNVHELRAYNRLAGMARGRYLLFLQDDDDQMTPEDCSWLPKLVAQFDAMPRLALVGMNHLQWGHGPGNDAAAHHFMDPRTGNNFCFALLVDFAPVMARRSAFKAVGGLDEGMGDRGECGIWSDWELSVRLWTAGWQVGYMHVAGKVADPKAEPGGTHKPETGARCWGRQAHVGGNTYSARWGNGWGSFSGRYLEFLENEVRLANLRELKPLYGTNCPFRKGCVPEGNPPLSADHDREYQGPYKPIVEA
ncbi:hypothetical protein HYH03_003235 [Edaphochlamys debaryana]|uniref:Uncharacterized protein n=1 Tax=Edaphochlamys debaryana TaxID=47281 RepID=A0A835Y9X2_9CHLO|nr:hypothetical protein HYH03_003235 [Edaphochlamys debaryana]|eukprot:KAG2499050.1 hypothetical protein HYH03_003235 [Edaphochlamys debaryana]